MKSSQKEEKKTEKNEAKKISQPFSFGKFSQKFFSPKKVHTIRYFEIKIL